MKKRPRFQLEEIRMNMAPMIDVTFLLLIFFMCTLKFKTLEGKLTAYLPKEVGRVDVNVPQPEDIEVALEVLVPGTRLGPDGLSPWSGDPGSRYRFGADRRLEYRVGPRRGTDLGFLYRRLADLRLADPERKAVIAPGRGVVHEEVVEVLDLMIDVGLDEVRIRGAE